MDFFTTIEISGFPLWVVLLICCGVFLASFMDSIAGGGGIISVPTYLMAFSGLPTYYALATNKLSSFVGLIVSSGRFIKNGYVNWRLAVPSMAIAVLCARFGTKLQHMTPDGILKYLLLAVLPVVAFLTLKTKKWPDEPEAIHPRKQAVIVYLASAVVGAYDGYYGPGAGTFLMLIFIRLAKLDTRTAAGGVKLVNMASNFGAILTAFSAGYIFWAIGLISGIASILGGWLGSGLAIKNGSKIVRPTVILVLVLLTVKVLSELFFPEFWS